MSHKPTYLGNIEKSTIIKPENNIISSKINEIVSVFELQTVIKFPFFIDGEFFIFVSC